MFHLDFGWARLSAHVKQATLGNRATPEGRRFYPPLFWKATLYVTVPAFTLILFLQLLWQDLSTPYGGYSAGYQAYGWCLLLALVLLTPLTMVKVDKAPGTLPPTTGLGTATSSSGPASPRWSGRIGRVLVLLTSKTTRARPADVRGGNSGEASGCGGGTELSVPHALPPQAMPPSAV